MRRGPIDGGGVEGVTQAGGGCGPGMGWVWLRYGRVWPRYVWNEIGPIFFFFWGGIVRSGYVVVNPGMGWTQLRYGEGAI